MMLLGGLSACGGGETAEETPAPSDTPEVQVVTVTPEAETPDPESTESVPAETEAEPVGFVNPLTGEATETDISQNRPIVAMLNTIKQALPQSGNSKADLLIEVPEEGGITRVMGVYQDLTDVGTLGTIRSTRDYFVQLTMGLDGLLVHAGGSASATEYLKSEGYSTLDFMSHGSLYWRDSYRKANVGTEHSLYTSSENLLNYLAGGTLRTQHEEGFVSPYVFTQDGTPEGGSSATTINVSFSSYKQTKFVYDASTKTYQVYAYGEPYVDEAADGAQVAVTNVIVIPTTQTTVDSEGHQDFDLSSGTGYYACGGAYIPIQWSKGGSYDPLVFTNVDGTPLELGVGKSYICICGTDRTVTFE
jgi:hypothetical protein